MAYRLKAKIQLPQREFTRRTGDNPGTFHIDQEIISDLGGVIPVAPISGGVEFIPELIEKLQAIAVAAGLPLQGNLEMTEDDRA